MTDVSATMGEARRRADMAANPARPPPPRDPTRAAAPEDHRARAEARLAEIRGSQIEGDNDFIDQFDIPRHLIPDGWDYNWKNWTVYGKEMRDDKDQRYFSNQLRAGWEPVPASRHPELTYPGYKGDTILRDGMILCERPMVLTQEARDRDQRKARMAVQAKEDQMRATPPGTLPRDADPRVGLRVNKSIGPVEIEG